MLRRRGVLGPDPGDKIIHRLGRFAARRSPQPSTMKLNLDIGSSR